MATEAKLEPGWLKRQLDDVAALGRAHEKIIRAAAIARKNGYTQPMSVEFTIAELRALAYEARYSSVRSI